MEKLSDGKIENLLDNMVIVVDTREKKNEHITKYLQEHNIPFIWEKLDSGDYSFILPDEKFNFLNKKFCIEKKNSLTEVAGNFGTNRERFKNEFSRAIANGVKMDMVIENASWKKVFNGSYRSQISPSSMVGSILSFSYAYNVMVWFVGKDESPMLIYRLLRNFARCELKKLQKSLDIKNKA